MSSSSEAEEGDGVRRVAVIAGYAPGRRTMCSCIAELGHEPLEIATVEDARRLDTAAVDLVLAIADDRPSRAQVAAVEPTVPLVILHHAPDPLPDPPTAMRLDWPLTLAGLALAIQRFPTRRAAVRRR